MANAGARGAVLLAGWLVNSLLSQGWMSPGQGLASYTLLLLAYLGVELVLLRRRSGQLFWLNPIVVASSLVLALPFGVSNALYLMPGDALQAAGVAFVDVTPWMNHLMLLVLLAACALWTGYSSRPAAALGTRLAHNRFLDRWVSPSTRPRTMPLLAVFGISAAARLAAVRLGVYGYSSDYERLLETAAYRQFLVMMDSLGHLGLVCVALLYSGEQRRRSLDHILLVSALTFEVAFGLLSGFKSAVVEPIVIVALVFYSQRGRFPRWFAPALLVTLVAAYSVIEPFRRARFADVTFEGTEVGSIVATLIDPAYDTRGGRGLDGRQIALQFLSRANLTYIGSLGVEYAAADRLGEDAPAFLRNIVLAPAYAVVPRFLWSGKPLANLGEWYTREVLGRPLQSSTGMGPITYLNFAGGAVAVAVGFLVVGCVGRCVFDGLARRGGGGVIMGLGLLPVVGLIDSEFYTLFVKLIRQAPLLLMAQYVLLEGAHRDSPTDRSAGAERA